MTNAWLTRWSRLRLMLGCWILGRDLLAVWWLLWLIRDRARNAVNEDGRVVLANCPPLAQALYAKTPGEWDFTMIRRDPVGRTQEEGR